ncbi:MAG: zf-HC2 domain-containing protein [Chloroflexi bacterium]|nr:zf-HC2 domain-containing protein [Chloroflexota bacterium]
MRTRDPGCETVHGKLEHYFDTDTDRAAIDAHLAGCPTARSLLADVRRRLRDLRCQDVVELVTDYLEGATGARLRARIEDHLLLCQGCREYQEQMNRSIAMLGRLLARDGRDAVPPALLDVFRRRRGRA